MAKTSDIKAGGAYVEFAARMKPLQDALDKIDGRLKTFTRNASSMVSSGVTKAFVGLTLALGAAKKGYDALIKTAQQMRETGTDEQREAIAKLDAAVGSLSEAFNKLLVNGIEKLAGPAAEGIEKITSAFRVCQSIVQQVYEKFEKVFSAIQQGSSKIAGLWNNLVNKAIERSPMLAKAAADSLKAAGEKAMQSWQHDNTLLDQLDQINDKVNRSAEDIKKANSIVDQLKSRWGDVGIEVDQVTGKVNGLGEAQKKILQLQNQARIAQLKAEKIANEQQQKALQTANKNMAENGPGMWSIAGGWLWNTVKAPVSSATYKSFNQIASDKIEGTQDEMNANTAEQRALQLQGESIDAQIKAIEEGSNWYEEADKTATDAVKTPVGSNTKAGSMTDKYAELTPAEQEIAKLNDQYAAMLAERIQQFREHGYSEEEATAKATEEFAADRKAVDEKIAKIREDAAKKEAEILAGGSSILDAYDDLNKSDLQKELDSIEENYIQARKQMIEQLQALGKTEEEAQRIAEAYLKEERAATDQLKQAAIKRDAEERAREEAERIEKEAAELKKAEIEQARAYVDEIEKGIASSERTYTSSGGTFNAFDELDSRNIAAESLNAEKEQVKLQKDMVERLRELIDAYEANETSTLALFA